MVGREGRASAVSRRIHAHDSIARVIRSDGGAPRGSRSPAPTLWTLEGHDPPDHERERRGRAGGERRLRLTRAGPDAGGVYGLKPAEGPRRLVRTRCSALDGGVRAAMDERFRDPGVAVDDFLSPVLVHCPRCGGAARVDCDHEVREAKATCPACGFSRVAEQASYAIGAPADPYFGYELWLQAPCCGHTLWARNREHLEFLRTHVGAKLRERPHPEGASQVRNRRMASRLPRWMTRAQNRERVLACLERLNSLVVEAGDVVTGGAP